MAGLRRVYGAPAVLSDVEVAEFALQKQRVRAGRDAPLPALLRRVVGMAVIEVASGAVKMHALGSAGLSEPELLASFLTLQAHHPRARLVVWNPDACLSLLAARTYHHDLVAPAFWACLAANPPQICKVGEHLAGGTAPEELTLLARLHGEVACEFPSETTLWQAFRRDEHAPIDVACRVRVRHLAWAYLRLCHVRGELGDVEYETLTTALDAFGPS